MKRCSRLFRNRTEPQRSARRASFRQRVPAAEALEARLALSGPTANGVDAMAVGDVNADRLVDVVVAGRVAGQNEVIVYDGHGNKGSATVNALVTLKGAQVPSTGPLQVAAGDFTGTGVSSLAVASAGGPATVTVFQFQLTGVTAPTTKPTADPQDHAVTASKLGSTFTPSGLAQAKGFVLAAADFDGSGADELAVAPAGPGATLIDIYKYQPSTQAWQMVKQINYGKLGITGGVWLSAGDVSGDGNPELVVGSRNSGLIAVYNYAKGLWQQKFSPLGSRPGGVRVAVVANEGAPGAIVTTTAAPASGTSTAAITWAQGWQSQPLVPIQSPGSGAWVPLGGGWVYPRSSLTVPSGSKIAISQGPVTPTVLLASANSTTLVVQGFGTNLKPAKAVTFTEPVLSAAASAGKAWTPLQYPGDLPGTPSTSISPIVAFPTINYHSPYKIQLSLATSSLSKGLLSASPLVQAVPSLWGPARVTNAIPQVPSGEGAKWLRERLLYAYSQAIGVAYQHHYNPYWAPQQGRSWNMVALGYQSQGIDCTNLTAYMYNNALGITLNSGTPKQASIGVTSAGNQYITVPSGMSNHVNVQVLAPPTGPTDYATFTSQLKPGDILFIDPTRKNWTDPVSPASCTHAITWLGTYGVMSNGAKSPSPLIIDSTGNQPSHTDANNHAIMGGVHIRPFGNASSLNAWYYKHVDHVLRILA